MPLIIVWFAIFAVGAGTFAVLHGKDESRDHDEEYAKASEEIQKSETRARSKKPNSKRPKKKKRRRPPKAENPKAKAKKSEEENAEANEGNEVEQEKVDGGEEMEGEAGGAQETVRRRPAESGAVVFSENCSTCHGATGHGGNGGPDLRTMPLAQTEEGAIQQVTNGGGGMPAFGGTLSEEEIENVAAYVAQEITHGE